MLHVVAAVPADPGSYATVWIIMGILRTMACCDKAVLQSAQEHSTIPKASVTNRDELE